MDKGLNKLLSSFKILNHLATQVSFFLKIYIVHSENCEYLNQVKLQHPYSKIPLNQAVSAALISYTLIICKSFFDEYNEEFIPNKHPHYSDRIIRLKKITKPIMNRVKKWKDFTDYRNAILAHNLRIKGVSIFDDESDKRRYEIPFSDSEYLLLVNLVIMLTQIVRSEFPELYSKLDWSETIASKTDVESFPVNVNAELSQLSSEIDIIKESLNP